MFTQKHYKKIAIMLVNLANSNVNFYVEMLKKDNPKFSEKIFRETIVKDFKYVQELQIKYPEVK